MLKNINWFVCAILLFLMAGCGEQSQAKQVTIQKQVSGIRFFDGSFNEAVAAAKEQDKLVMVDVYTQWCGPCKVMAKEVFPREEVGDFYNQHFINLKLDAEDEEINGPAIAEKFSAYSYPTYLFLNSDGELVKKISGSSSPKAFIGYGRVAMGGSSNFLALRQSYENGDRSLDALSQLSSELEIYVRTEAAGIDRQALKKLYVDVANLAREFLNSTDESTLKTSDAFQLFSAYSRASMHRGDSAVELVASKFPFYEGDIGSKKVAEALHNINYRAIKTAAKNGDAEIFRNYLRDMETGWSAVYEHLNTWPFEGASRFQEVSSLAEADFAISQRDWERYFELLEETFARWDGRGNTKHTMYWMLRFLNSEEAPMEYYPRALAHIEAIYQSDKRSDLAETCAQLAAKSGQPAKARNFYLEALDLLQGTGMAVQKRRSNIESQLNNLGSG